MDVHFKLTPPVQLLFHEQAKSLIALQELQNEVSSLLDFKNALLETFPILQSKLTHVKSHDGLEDSNWSRDSNLSNVKKIRKSPDGSNVSDSGFGTSNELKDNGFGVSSSHENEEEEVDDDELLSLLELIQSKALRLRKAEDKHESSEFSVRRLGAISELEDESSSKKNPFPSIQDFAALQSEREVLLQRVSELEQLVDSRKRENAGIIHSVQIRTSGSSHNKSSPNSVVNIEIKNKHRGSSFVNLKNDAPSTTFGNSVTFSDRRSSLIGHSDKVKLFENERCHVSVPPELKVKSQWKPNREKIRSILKMNDVLSLQKKLLTTVMENEIYNSTLEQVSEVWPGKVEEFERLISSLQFSLSQVQSENVFLKNQIKLRDEVSSKGVKNHESTSRIHFDFYKGHHNTVTPRPVTILPSDTRQRLEEMASANQPKNYKIIPPEKWSQKSKVESQKDWLSSSFVVVPDQQKHTDANTLRHMDRNTMASLLKMLSKTSSSPPPLQRNPRPSQILDHEWRRRRRRRRGSQEENESSINIRPLVEQEDSLNFALNVNVKKHNQLDDSLLDSKNLEEEYYDSIGEERPEVKSSFESSSSSNEDSRPSRKNTPLSAKLLRLLGKN